MLNTRGMTYNYQALQDKFKEYIRNRGIDFPATFHYPRHSFATFLNSDSIPMDVIQKLLGHAQISTTAGIYADTMDDKVNEYVESVSYSFRERLKPLKDEDEYVDVE